MVIRLKTAVAEDAGRLNEMQARAFTPLAIRYDDNNSPAAESIDRTLERISQPGSNCHIILADDFYVGMVRVKDMGEGVYKISPLFVIPEFQNRGIAQAAMRLLDDIYPDARVWTLFTILQEERNCHLYEKLGYVQTGAQKKINEKMTMIGYERRVHQ